MNRNRKGLRFGPLIITVLLLVLSLVPVLAWSWWWAMSWIVLIPLVVIGCWDLLQKSHSIRRNFPIVGRMRWMLEEIRPEIQQYFVERDTDGTPYDRTLRSLVYERAKDTHDEQPFGTELDVYAEGYEFFAHSMTPKPPPDEPFKVRLDGPEVTQPYDIALLNISAMSFGALSGPAILALNEGARLGGFAHDTGEGGISRYHREPGGDLIWEIGTAYFGCRTPEGNFDPDRFAEQARTPQVKATHIKISQGAKPGLGGVMPAAKVTKEIAEIRGVPVGEKCVSPGYHTAFSTPIELLEFVAELRRLSGGKPAGFKLCVGQRSEFLAICKGMLETQILPEFITVDGAEGGTGAAPLEFEDRVGTPLDEGLLFVHNALVGSGLRERIRLGASGKVVSGFTIAKRMVQGADYTNAARAMMFAVGCIQAQRCQTNRCPVGVTTHDPTLTRGLDVASKAQRVAEFQSGTVASFNQLIGALGLDDPAQLSPSLLHRRISTLEVARYDQIHHYLAPGQLLDGDIPESWRSDWNAAQAHTFAPADGIRR